MARKEEQYNTISDEENKQLQQFLAEYSERAAQVRACTTSTQVEEALSDITSLSEGAQEALLKELVKAQTIDAADILTAINAFAPSKEVRKEARRALLRLDSVKVFSGWTPPIARSSSIQVNISHEPRFWKGYISQSREEGEIQMMLLWEQGYDYSEVRSVGFLIDFWEKGIKDAYSETVNKRTADQQVSRMKSSLVDVHIVECTLAQGKRLLEEALSVSEWRGTELSKEYRNRIPTYNQLIFQATDLGKDDGQTFINPDLEDQEVLVNFLGAWSLGDYGLAYDLLTKNSSARNNLSRDEWITGHRAWYNEANPTRLELGFVHEREQAQSALWLPSSAPSRSITRKEIELGWSLELLDTPLSGTLREMPLGTAVNKDTGRHWFWTSYSLEHTPEGWRIQQIKDEGAALQGLSITELQKRVKTYEEAIETQMKQRDEDVEAVMRELTWRVSQLLCLYDALIVKLPLDRQINEEAYSRAVFAGNPERIVVYLERMVQRFPDNKSELLRRLGATFVGLAYNYVQVGMEERADLFFSRAEESLKESLAIQDTVTGHILLGELYLGMDKVDEAEAELLVAQKISTGDSDTKSVESGLGSIEMRREHFTDAIPHYQRVTQIDPTYPGIWFSLGFAYRRLDNFTNAEQAYLRAIEVEPTDIRPYSELTAIYTNQQRPEKAQAILSQGLSANPDSAHLHALNASLLFELGDTKKAQRELQTAEAIDPSLEIVQAVRSIVDEKTKKR